MSNTPSLAELLAFADAFDWEGWAEPKNAQAAFAKAVLDRWGTPQPLVRDDTELIQQMLEALVNPGGDHELLRRRVAVVKAARARLENT